MIDESCLTFSRSQKETSESGQNTSVRADKAKVFTPKCDVRQHTAHLISGDIKIRLQALKSSHHHHHNNNNNMYNPMPIKIIRSIRTKNAQKSSPYRVLAKQDFTTCLHLGRPRQTHCARYNRDVFGS
jgi:hypothetical protein